MRPGMGWFKQTTRVAKMMMEKISKDYGSAFMELPFVVISAVRSQEHKNCSLIHSLPEFPAVVCSSCFTGLRQEQILGSGSGLASCSSPCRCLPVLLFRIKFSLTMLYPSILTFSWFVLLLHLSVSTLHLPRNQPSKYFQDAAMEFSEVMSLLIIGVAISR